MTKTERLMKAFENEKVDRVPVGFWFHLPEDMESVSYTHLGFMREP